MDAAVKEILKLQKQFQPILELANNFPISNDVLKQIDYINSIIPQNIQELSKLINSFQLPEKIKQSHTLEKLLEQNMELNEMYNEISYEEIDQAQKELQEECLDSEEKQSAYTFLEQLKQSKNFLNNKKNSNDKKQLKKFIIHLIFLLTSKSSGHNLNIDMIIAKDAIKQQAENVQSQIIDKHIDNSTNYHNSTINYNYHCDPKSSKKE